jgi:hypothetical protein
MLRSLAVARIQRGLGFRSDLEDEIISALQEAQRLLELGRTLPFFLLQEDEALSITSGSGALALPTGFIREKDDEGPHLVDDDGKLYFMEKMDFERAKLTFDSDDPGRPLAYVLRKATMLVYPERDTTYDGTWSYYKGADVLTSDIENAWLQYAPETLIGAGGLIIAKDARNPSAVQIFSEMLGVANAGQFAESILRDEANKPRNMGSNL